MRLRAPHLPILLATSCLLLSPQQAPSKKPLAQAASIKPAVEPSGRETILTLIAGEWIAKSLYAAVRLNIASHLGSGPKRIEELAVETQSDEESLYRLMRMLASAGVFHEEEGRIFSHSPASELLAKEHPQSLYTLVKLYSQEVSQSWDKLPECIQEGKPAFQIFFGQPVFPYFRQRPQLAAEFHVAMWEKSRAVTDSCLKSYDFSKFSSVCDIGGGLGPFLSAILNAYPKTKGILYELPEVATAAKDYLEKFRNRCELISGDFFTSIPSNSEAYLLKSVLHDWNDEDTLKILEACHRGMSKNSKLIIIEPLITYPNQMELAKTMDVYMMAIRGGKERTAQDFRKLLDEAGFAVESITPTETEFYLIQACKKSS